MTKSNASLEVNIKGRHVIKICWGCLQYLVEQCSSFCGGGSYNGAIETPSKEIITFLLHPHVHAGFIALRAFFTMHTHTHTHTYYGLALLSTSHMCKDTFRMCIPHRNILHTADVYNHTYSLLFTLLHYILRVFFKCICASQFSLCQDEIFIGPFSDT